MCCFAVLGVLSSFAIIVFGCFTFVVFLFHVTVSMLCLFHSVVGWFADSVVEISTVNSKIFARFLYAKFRENKILE